MSDDLAGKDRRTTRGPGCLAVLLALLVLVGGIGFALFQARTFLEEALSSFTGPADYDGDGRGRVVVRVHDGDTASEIGRTLERRGVVQTVGAFYEAAVADPRSRGIQPGYYRLRRHMSSESAIELLLDSSARIVDQVTVPEGLRVSEVLATLAEGSPRLRMEPLRRAAREPARLGLPPYARGRAEGFLFPATYEVAPDTTARSQLAAMVASYDQTARAIRLARRASARGITPREAVVVASLVQAEARQAEDFGKVARVIYNRLDRGIALQLDSTVHYATGDDGTVTTTEEERAVDSSYNTYRYAGLPPGPINSPGRLALEAAVAPTPGDWLYFVTVNLSTGETAFAETLTEHNGNVARFQAWCTAHPGSC